MEYSVAIRTLGTAGKKYQILLDSLKAQTIKPKDIFIYIAEGYDIPKETIGIEKYVYVKKGMVSQRALSYEEIKSEYILFLDDDLYLPPSAVEKMYSLILQEKADVISPDILPNHNRTFWGRVMMFLSGRMRGRYNDNYWGYKVMMNAGYSYNLSPKKDVYESQTNAGACFLCRKSDFLKISFEDELWLDSVNYPLGEDQVMYYKMYLNDLKILTWYNHGLEHLDGSSGRRNDDYKKIANLIFSDFRFKTIFWHRFIYLQEKKGLYRFMAICAVIYTLIFTILISLMKCDINILRVKINALKNGVDFIKSDDYKNLPEVIKS